MALLLAVAGCSGEPFHLRGSKLLPELIRQGVDLQGVDPRSDFGIALRDGLEDVGVTILPHPLAGATTLTIVNLRETKTVSGYSSTRQVREFNHALQLDFQVKTPDMAEAVTRSVRAERSQVYDGQYVLGTAEEEALIKDALRREVVRLLLLRLQALQR
ncbi:MAG: LPS assembly lipoprotein LptE [Thiothrix sp.]